MSPSLKKRTCQCTKLPCIAHSYRVTHMLSCEGKRSFLQYFVAIMLPPPFHLYRQAAIRQRCLGVSNTSISVRYVGSCSHSDNTLYIDFTSCYHATKCWSNFRLNGTKDLCESLLIIFAEEWDEVTAKRSCHSVLLPLQLYLWYICPVCLMNWPRSYGILMRCTEENNLT